MEKMNWLWLNAPIQSNRLDFRWLLIQGEEEGRNHAVSWYVFTDPSLIHFSGESEGETAPISGWGEQVVLWIVENIYS